MRTACLIRHEPAYRRDAFVAGLKAVGCDLGQHPPDLVVCWNRYGDSDRIGKDCERRGGTVLVAENGPLGREFRGGHYYTICRSRHNTVGTFPEGGPKRWSAWNVPMQPWRRDGKHILVLPARGIGTPPVVQPLEWLDQTLAWLARATRRPVKVRQHPGEKTPSRPLEEDLRNAWCCLTWGSGAALKALLAGVPVFYGYPGWIGRSAAWPIGCDLEEPFLGDRLPMFQQLAWSMWEVGEIATGEPFRRLLCAES